MSYYESHRSLSELFSGYLNQDWKEIYAWNGTEPNYQSILRKYKTEDSVEGIKKTIAELKDLITICENFNYDQWVETLSYDLGLGLRPKGFDLSHKEWLEDVLKILEEPIEETLTHFIPERV